jgi:hypothetical protein
MDDDVKSGAASTSRLPDAICALDIETAEVDFLFPEEADLAIVGTIVYRAEAGTYLEGPHRCYRTEDLPELEKFLSSFPGIIIGHNILGFDYRALRQRLNLEGIVEKTVDTQLLLFEKLGGDKRQLRNLSLDSLGKLNFGEGKTAKGGSVSDLWRAGREDEVIAYNATDCRLTEQLWERLVMTGTIAVGSQTTPRQILMSPRETRILQGLESRFSYETWRDKLDRDGYIMIPPTMPATQKIAHEDLWIDGKSAGHEFETFLLDMIELGYYLPKSAKRELALDAVGRERLRIEALKQRAREWAGFSLPHDMRPRFIHSDGTEGEDDFEMWLWELHFLEDRAGGDLPHQMQTDVDIRRDYDLLRERFGTLWSMTSSPTDG